MTILKIFIAFIIIFLSLPIIFVSSVSAQNLLPAPGNLTCSNPSSPCTTLTGEQGRCVQDINTRNYECVSNNNPPANPGANPPANPGANPPANPGSYDFPNPISCNNVPCIITKIADFLLDLALAFAFIMIIWAGFKFVTSGGNEERLTSAKKNFTWVVIGIAVILASKALVTYIQEILGVKEVKSTTFQDFLNKVGGTLNLIIVFLFSLTTVYFLMGVVQYVMGAQGDDEKLNQGKRHMVWGIIGMAIMASAWGIAEIIKNYVT